MRKCGGVGEKLPRGGSYSPREGRRRGEARVWSETRRSRKGEIIINGLRFLNICGILLSNLSPTHLSKTLSCHNVPLC